MYYNGTCSGTPDVVLNGICILGQEILDESPRLPNPGCSCYVHPEGDYSVQWIIWYGPFEDLVGCSFYCGSIGPTSSPTPSGQPTPSGGFPTPTPTPCPVDCSTLPEFYTATISDIGGGCEPCDSSYERAYAVQRTGCTWHRTHTDPYEIILDIDCVAGKWEMDMYLNCDGGGGCSYIGLLTGNISSKPDPRGTYNLSGVGLTAIVVVS